MKVSRALSRYSLEASRALSRHSLTALRALSRYSLAASRVLLRSAKTPRSHSLGIVWRRRSCSQGIFADLDSALEVFLTTSRALSRPSNYASRALTRPPNYASRALSRPSNFTSGWAFPDCLRCDITGQPDIDELG